MPLSITAQRQPSSLGGRAISLGVLCFALSACGSDGVHHRTKIDPGTAPDGSVSDHAQGGHETAKHKDAGAVAPMHDAGSDGGMPVPDGGPPAATDGGMHDAGLDARTGEGGPADGGHDAGHDAAPACTAESCDDHDSCNGIESCSATGCVAGTPPCQNPDALHCDVTCQVADAGVTCLVSGRDVDQDGFSDSACVNALSSGADCDDANAAVHPGASEACDGIDNDCNGKSDIADGLPLAGENTSFGPGSHATIAATDRQAFGVAYLQADVVWLRVLDDHGLPKTEPTLVSPSQSANPAHPELIPHPGIDWNGQNFGLSWTRTKQFAFQQYSFDAQALGGVLNLAPENYASFGRSRTLATGSDEWIVPFECCMSRPRVWARRIKGGQLLEPLYDLSAYNQASLYGASVLGDQVGVTWFRESYDASRELIVELGRRPLDLGPSDGPAVLLAHEVPIYYGARWPVNAAGPDGWMVVWYQGYASDGTRHLFAAKLDPHGAMLCGPVDLAASYPADATIPGAEAIVATKDGYLVATRARPKGAPVSLELLEIGSDCQLKSRIPVDTSEDSYSVMSLARTDNGRMLLMWEDGQSGNLKQRSFGPRLCD
jgi:hypothetical protein